MPRPTPEDREWGLRTCQIVRQALARRGLTTTDIHRLYPLGLPLSAFRDRLQRGRLYPDLPQALELRLWAETAFYGSPL